jgi:ABC-type branched-subunit amino acid transport system substrate-binding protein
MDRNAVRRALAALAALLGLAPAGVPAQGAPIVLGQTIALTGGPSEHGKAVVAGAQLYFDKVNRDGGVGGRKIALRTLDDGGDSKRAAQNTAQLIDDDKVAALFGGIEGGPCVASMKVAAEKRVPLVACMAGSPELREPFQRYVFPVRAAHYDEFARLIDIATTYGHRSFAFLHSDSDTGRQHLANVRKLLAARGLELAAAIALSVKPEPAKIAQALKAQAIDAMFNHGSYAVYAQIITESRKLGLQTQFMAVNSGAQQMVQLLGKQAAGVIFTQVVPYPWTGVPAVVKEFRDAAGARSPATEVSFSALEGYVSAKVMVEALRRAGSARKATERETLVAALESMARYDLGGMEVSFTPLAHRGSEFVDIVVVATDGRFVR